MDWYIARGTEADGPYTLDDLVERLKQGSLHRDALVWRDGMPGWEPIENVDDFREFVVRRPPPVPQANAIAPMERDEWSLPTRQGPALEAAVGQAGPWSRYFARQFDVILCLMVAGFVFGFAASTLSKSGSAVMQNFSPGAFSLMLLPFAFVLNACIANVFGNTLGKRLFGLRAVPSKDRDVDLGWLLRRELRVWIFGWGAGIPLVSLATVILNYIAVRKSGTARYDRGKAEVLGLPIGNFRRFLAICASVGMIFLGIALDGLASRSDREPGIVQTREASIHRSDR